MVDGLRRDYSGIADVVALNPDGADRTAVRNLMIKYHVTGTYYPIFVFTNSNGDKQGSALHGALGDTQAMTLKKFSRRVLSSRLDALLPKLTLSRPTLSTSYPKVNSAFSFRGTCSPRRGSSVPLKLYVQRKVGSTYKAWRTVSVSVPARSTTYAKRYTMPIRGAFRVRAYHSDAAHGASRSSYRAFTVK